MNEVFEALYAKYGFADYVVWGGCCYTWGYIRYRHYNDGAWLQGYDSEPVIYWGA